MTMLFAVVTAACSFDTTGEGTAAGPDVATEAGDETRGGPTTSGSSVSASTSAGTGSQSGTNAATSEPVGESSSGGVEDCDNGELDPPETAVDCGGPCAGCPNGSACNEGADCTSLACVDSECADSRCDDGVAGGDETDVDCGGSCERCQNGQRCGDPDDCIETICFDQTCFPAACNDGMLNGGETDVDCGGPCPVCGLGDACVAPMDCVNQSCVNLICGCDAAFTNGGFDDGLTGWDADGCWGVGGDGRAACTEDNVGGDVISQAVGCRCTALSAPVVLGFSVRWDHDNIGDFLSGHADLSLSVDGVEYLYLRTGVSDDDSGTVEYRNGATGNQPDIIEGQFTPFELTLPAFTVSNPVLSLRFGSSISGDDISIDDFVVEGTPCPSG